MSTELDKFGIPFFHKTKADGYFYEMSDDPRNDAGMDHLDEDFDVSNGIITMHPSGPTSFGVGKNVRGFQDSIGGCDMDFKETAARGFAYKEDDVRDLEFKCLMKIDAIGNHGFSMSACTGHHDSDHDPCCQGFAYMCTVEAGVNPAKFRFRKEEYHVNYTNSPEGKFTHSAADFKLDGHGWFGYGFCRYNKMNQGTEDSVVLEVWFNPNPEADLKNWTMLKRIEDKKGRGWGEDCDECGGDVDQVGTWSNAQNRLKTNANDGTIQFKAISFREIDPTLD
jgi:hypothetical protein